MELFDRVLVALARRDSDAALMRYAKCVADLVPSAVFYFVHVDETSSGEEDFEEKIAANFGIGPRVTCRVVPGHREDELLRQAADTCADLILLGHRKDHSGRRSLARRLAMKAPCSIWMVPDESPARISNILVAVDFSHPAAHALSIAAALASRRGLDAVSALHVYFDASLAATEEYQMEIRGREEEALGEFLRDLDLHGVRVQTRFEESSNVSHAIARAAVEDRVDLVVMGTRGMTRSASILLGSESEQAIINTQIPLLVVKRRGERQGFLKLWLEHGLDMPGGPKFG